MGERRHVSATEDQAVPTRQDHRARPNLAAHLRRNAARHDAAAHAERDAGATGRASFASEWMVARHRATAPRVEAGQVRRSRTPELGTHVEGPARTLSRLVDPRGLECPDSATHAAGARRCGSTRPNTGNSRE